MIFGEMEMFVCSIEIENGQRKTTQTINAPRFVLQQQFVSLVQEASQLTTPVRIKMSRKVPIYDNFDNKWIEREASIVFENKSYEAKSGGNTDG